MSETGETVAKAKKYADYAQKGAAKIAAASEAAKKLEDAGQTLDELQKVAKALNWMSKVSAGLQVVSIGLSVAQAFLPIKSQEDLIYEAVLGLRKDLKELGDRLSGEIKQLSDDLQLASQKIPFEKHMNAIDTAGAKVNSLTLLRQKRDPAYAKRIAEEEKELAQRGFSDLDDALTAIAIAVKGTEIEDSSLLRKVYENSHGDLRKVGVWVDYLTKQANMALSAKVVIRNAQEKLACEEHGSAWTEDDAIGLADTIGTLPETVAQLADISEGCQTYLNLCSGYNAITGNIKAVIEKNKSEWLANTSSHQARADTILAGLSNRWPWLNFTVLVAPGLTNDADSASICGGGAIIDMVYYQRTEAEADDKPLDAINVTIMYAIRKSPSVAEPVSTVEAIKMTSITLGRDISANESKRLSLIPAVFDMTEEANAAEPTQSLSSFTEKWPAYKAAETSGAKDLFQRFADMASAMKEPWQGELVWMQRLDHIVSDGLIGLDHVVGLSSQNTAFLWVPQSASMTIGDEKTTMVVPRGVVSFVAFTEIYVDPAKVEELEEGLKKLLHHIEKTAEKAEKALAKKAKSLELPDGFDMIPTSVKKIPTGPF